MKGDRLAERLAQLKAERDELRLQIHLARLDIQSEWQEVEKKWRDIETKLNAATHAVKDSSRPVAAATGKALDEIRAAYKRVRAALRS